MKMYTIFCYTLCLLLCLRQLPIVLGADETNFNGGHHHDISKEKRGVGSVVDTVQGVHGQSVAGTVGAHGIPIHIPVPRPYPVGVPVAVRVAVPKPYPVPVLVDPASANGLDYGLGLYGHASSYDYNHLLNYLAKSAHAHNHLAHLTAGHDQHSLANYALSKLIH